jgi:hypothetical protein
MVKTIMIWPVSTPVGTIPHPLMWIARFSPLRCAVSAVPANQDWPIVKVRSGTDPTPL